MQGVSCESTYACHPIFASCNLTWHHLYCFPGSRFLGTTHNSFMSPFGSFYGAARLKEVWVFLRIPHPRFVESCSFLAPPSCYFAKLFTIIHLYQNIKASQHWESGLSWYIYSLNCLFGESVFDSVFLQEKLMSSRVATDHQQFCEKWEGNYELTR